MVEVLVTIVILTFGLLGMAGLQARLQMSQMEAYQRAQGLMFLEDMANRISANRNNAVNYVTGTSSPLGTGNTCTYTSSSTRQVQDSCEWSETLKGAAELSGSTKVGAFIGGRGCVESLGNGEYMVTVAWQGTSALTAPPSSVACGVNQYDGTNCANDVCRRVLTTVVRVANLSS